MMVWQMLSQGTLMRIAAFNVENLFDRPIAFNLADESKGQAIITAVADFNNLINKAIYSEADKVEMLDLIKFLKLTSSKPPYVEFRKIRGQLWRKPQGAPLQIVAKGRADWVGWVELKTEPNNATAVMNTGRVIRDVEADILAVIEAEDRVALREFSEQVLLKVGGTGYDEIMLIDGNDDRGIDVGLMTRGGYRIGLMRSHVHDFIGTSSKRVYSRDCPEYAVTTPHGETIWVLPNHFKSKYGGNDQPSKDKRRAQAERTAAIYNELLAAGHGNVVVLGDLNDTPDSSELVALVQNTTLRDVSAHPTFNTGSFAGKGTFGLGNDNQKIDYLLLSPAMFDRVTASGLFRKGAWPGSSPKRWDVYDELKQKIHVASDHHVIFADISAP
jgi:endonuclease/exonuclease/phosphatase family metal-dependent hydrolase